MRGLTVVVVLGLFFGSTHGGSSVVTLEQDVIWDPEVRLTNNSLYEYTDYSNQRNVVVDPAGRVHVVWYRSGTGTFGIQLMYKRYTPGWGWSQDTCITQENTSLYHSRYPSLACDSSGVLGVVYNCGNASNPSQYVYFKQCVPQGTGNDGWDSVGTLISNDIQSQYKYVPSIAASPDGRFHAAWTQDRSPDFSVTYRERIGTTWQPEVNISSNVYYKSGTCVAAGRDGTVHVVWHGTLSTNSYYQVQYLGRFGGTWMTTPQNVSAGGAQHCYYPSLAVDPTTNRPAVTWYVAPVGVPYQRIVYKSRLGTTPSDPWQAVGDTLSESGSNFYQYGPHLTFTTMGSAHVVWYANSIHSPSWYQLRYNERLPGHPWDNPVSLTFLSSHRYMPSLASGGDSTHPYDLHLVWYDYRFGGAGEIYYRRAQPAVPLDVGVASFVPNGLYLLDSMVPRAWVKNYGTGMPDSFDVRLSITPGYSSTVRVAGMAPGESTQVFFPVWQPAGTGIYAATCSTQLAGDACNSNDARVSTSMIADFLDTFDPDDGAYRAGPPTGGWTWRRPAAPRPGPISPPNVWTLPDSGNYGTNGDWYLYSCYYRAEQDWPTLAFWHWYNTETARDGGNLQVTTDRGASWQRLTPWTLYSLPYYGYVTALADTGWSGSSETWRIAWFRVPVSRGTVFKLLWRFRSDASGQYPGWMIDNVAGLGARHVVDVAAVRIIAPRDTVDYASSVTPRAQVRNFGSRAQVCDVRLTIGDRYAAVESTRIGPDDSTVVVFPSWVVDTSGATVVTCSTALVNDDVPGNDRIEQPLFLRRIDVGPIAILSPYDTLPGAVFAPSVRLANFGTGPAVFDLRLLIDRGGDVVVYDTTETGIRLEAGDTVTHVFAKAWHADSVGVYAVTAHTMLVGDQVPANDLARKDVRIAKLYARGWREMQSMPSLPSGKAVKDGGWLAGYDGLIYAAKGTKTGDFYCYHPFGDSWRTLASIPAGQENKPPAKGAVGAAGPGVVYATKGNNTQGFYGYDIARDSWYQLADVPLGTTGKKVKGGTDLVYVPGADVRGQDDGPDFGFRTSDCGLPASEEAGGFVYLLKGYKNEFWRYDVLTNSWQSLAPAPLGVSGRGKYDRGSWLVWNQAGTIFVHKSKYHELYAYSIEQDSWSGQLTGMPLSSVGGKKKKAKDGSCAVWLDSLVYALKGGNTQDFYSYDPATDSWTTLETIPAFGTANSKKKVKTGGDLTVCGPLLYALKGNKCLEFWRYVPASAPVDVRSQSETGVQARVTESPGSRLALVPNPIRAGLVTVNLPGAGDRLTAKVHGPIHISVYDAAGREVIRSGSLLSFASPVTLDLRLLRAGVYLVRLDDKSTNRQLAAARLVVVR
ncbi:MAG: hypothetical protein ABIK86_02010 [candidate division WOR-3 bacterium]